MVASGRKSKRCVVPGRCVTFTISDDSNSLFDPDDPPLLDTPNARDAPLSTSTPNARPSTNTPTAGPSTSTPTAEPSRPDTSIPLPAKQVKRGRPRKLKSDNDSNNMEVIKKKKTKKIDKSENVSYIYCTEKWEDSRTCEIWVQCTQCMEWFHEKCSPGLEQCELCLE